MNNKGFTLIEMLVVIVVLGVVGVVITLSLTQTLRDTTQEECDAYVEEVEDAACVYVSLSEIDVVCNRSYCEPIPLEYLVEEGLIKSDEDACTNKEIDLNQTVTVKWSDTGEKICTYNGVREYER